MLTNTAEIAYVIVTRTNDTVNVTLEVEISIKCDPEVLSKSSFETCNPVLILMNFVEF